jgi:dTDP-glucose 4,6-dehydratase
MHLALTGASGFIGAAIARHAAAAGHSVHALVRASSRRDHIEPFVSRFVVGAHDDARARAELLDPVDAVIHNSFDWKVLKAGDIDAHFASNMRGSIDLLEASGERPFIYMSSISVHHVMDPRWGGVIDEAHPSRPGTLYGALKASIEAHLWSAHAQRKQPITALRPCGVYGIDPSIERSIGWPIIESLRRGEPFSRAGGGKFVHVDDVAAATVACLDNPAASPKVYNLVDCYLRWADWASIAAELLGVEVPIDLSSPAAPKNTFDTAATLEDLGVSLTRGRDGIRDHVASLINMGPS